MQKILFLGLSGSLAESQLTIDYIREHGYTVDTIFHWPDLLHSYQNYNLVIIWGTGQTFMELLWKNWAILSNTKILYLYTERLHKPVFAIQRFRALLVKDDLSSVIKAIERILK